MLDVMLMLHAEHGGGNNSTFTTRVLSSSGTDAYSTYAAAMGSLKGPKHGGANAKVGAMIEDVAAHVLRWDDDDELASYLERIAAGEAFDGTGLVYGMATPSTRRATRAPAWSSATHAALPRSRAARRSSRSSRASSA